MVLKDLSKYLAVVQAYTTTLSLLEGEYLANPGEFRKRLTPTLAESARKTPKVNGRIRWRDFITHLSDEGVIELFWILKEWSEENES